ncbi:hypothetical protein CR513_52739, partial [Mucuna pruriens]
MEESQYLLWIKRKQMLKSHIQQPFNTSSWEERAFAEDAARILGGTLPTSKVSSSTQETCYQPTMSPYSSSINWGHHMVSPDSEPKEQVSVREEFLKGLGCNDYVETGLSVGQSSVFGQKLPIDSCGDEAISYKRSKTSLPVFLKPCSNDRHLTFQSAEFVLGLKPGMEELDLELRLGKPQKYFRSIKEKHRKRKENRV